MKQLHPFFMLATSQDPKLRSIANLEKQRLIVALNKIDVAIEPQDFSNPDLLYIVTDGMVKYKGNHILRYILQNIAMEGIIVAYYCDDGPRGKYEGLAYVNWRLWEEWITEDPTISQLRETFTAKT